jgi:hypothetical protein
MLDSMAAFTVLLLSFPAGTTTEITLFVFALEVTALSFALRKFLSEKLDKLGIGERFVLAHFSLNDLGGLFELLVLSDVGSESIESALEGLSFSGRGGKESRLVEVFGHTHHI